MQRVDLPAFDSFFERAFTIAQMADRLVAVD